jgi:hypothetical protein
MPDILTAASRHPVILPPGAGRAYPMGHWGCVQSRRRRDSRQYSISEWWLEPNTRGPGAHSHPEDDVFYVSRRHDERFGRGIVDARRTRVLCPCSWWPDSRLRESRFCSRWGAEPIHSGRLRATHAWHLSVVP